MSTPFVFYTQQQLVSLTGRRAGNLSQLLGHLRDVTGSSIFYHTHYLYLTQHFVQPKFYNEFATMTGTANGSGDVISMCPILRLTFGIS